jgi:adenylate cyclase class 2
MFEVEVKIRADHDAVRSRLEARGGAQCAKVRQVDTYYDAPHRDFAETDEALRIRRETRRAGEVDDETERGADETAGDDQMQDGGDETTVNVTYKGPLLDEASKTRTEHETAVLDGETMDAILGGLGFEPVATVEKDRDVFDVDGYTVTLDTVAGVGSFVEVEREAEADVESVREDVFDVARDLGLDPTDQIRTSYLGMLLDDDEA